VEGSAEIIDNLRVRMGDVLACEVKAGDRLCAVTEMFSLSAFSRLKDKLLSVKDARFIFSAPTFTPAATLAERMDKARRQFMVSEQNRRESSVVADEYELKLRNRMMQKAVARECADWIRQKAHFASPDNFELGLQTFLTAKHREGALVRFSPRSKEMAALLPGDTRTIDVLFATDCISEGQNLQDCDTVVNYDIHWNPVRLVQRFGRIDRIGSKNATIQMVNFWPNLDMDEYLRLRKRVDSRMTIAKLNKKRLAEKVPKNAFALTQEVQQLKRELDRLGQPFEEGRS